jgi:hypothetical protein
VLFERATRPDSDRSGNAEPGSEPTPDIQQLDQVNSKEEP